MCDNLIGTFSRNWAEYKPSKHCWNLYSSVKTFQSIIEGTKLMENGGLNATIQCYWKADFS